MFRDLLTAFLAIAAVTQAAAVISQQPTGNVTPGNAAAANVSSANAASPAPLDPAAVIFATDVGLVLHAVKPASVTDYENAIVALQDALSKAEDPETRNVAAGWRVYKATELDAKANPLYVHMLLPATAGVDYRPSLWLDKLLDGAPAELLAKYRDAFAAPPSKLALVEFANMSVAPVAKPTNATPSEPAKNASPRKPPGNYADFSGLR